jgi:hypothetical protein
LIIVSLLTPNNEDKVTEKFFLKMRTRVRGQGPEADALDVKESFSNPEKTKKYLLFPNTNLELYRWDKFDFIGFLISIVIVFIVLGTLFTVVNIT